METRRRGKRLIVLLLAAVACLPFMSVTSDAAFPGANGRIVFEGGGALQTINPDGTGLTTIPNTVGATRPVWSKDGTKIAFQKAGDVWTMNADGSNQVNVTTGLAPSWSPDGTQIAFQEASDIWVMNSDGGNQQNLTNDAFNDNAPSFSPDGTRIAWESNRSGDTQVWSMSNTGLNPTPVSTVGDVEGRPSWSPDGSRIAFTTDPGAFVEVFTASAAGGNDTRITFNSSGPVFNEEPAWSPDGAKIAFSSNRVGGFQIWLSSSAPDPTSSSQTQVTTTGGHHPDWETLPVAPAPSAPPQVGPPVPPNFSTAIFQSPFLYLRLKCPARFKPLCIGRAAAMTSKHRCAGSGRHRCQPAKQITGSVSARQKPTKWKVARLKVRPRFLALVAKMAKTPDKKLLIVRQLIHSTRFRGGQTQAVYHIYRVRTATTASR